MPRVSQMFTYPLPQLSLLKQKENTFGNSFAAILKDLNKEGVCWILMGGEVYRAIRQGLPELYLMMILFLASVPNCFMNDSWCVCTCLDIPRLKSSSHWGYCCHWQMRAARIFLGFALWPLGEPARSVLWPLQSFSPGSLTGLGEGGLELV